MLFGNSDRKQKSPIFISKLGLLFVLDMLHLHPSLIE